MSTADYLDTVKARLIGDNLISEFLIRRERITLTDGHIRAKLELMNGSMLEFSEYFQLLAGGDIEIVTYSYYWADEGGVIIRRWDNTPHHRELSGFPHHIHEHGGVLLPGQPVSIFDVLDEISKNQK